MARLMSSLLAGLLFGAGLALSGMTDPAKVLGFLDVAGDWDPSLAFVMGGALAVTLIGYRLLRRWPAPLLDTRFHLPTRRDIDAPLIGGAVLFGIGWGLAGYCPGPAIASLTIGGPGVWLFLLFMLLGMALYRVLDHLRRPAP